MSASTMVKANNKRKRESDEQPGKRKPETTPRKRPKLLDARQIAVQTADDAFKDGELDVDRFIRAREWEIRALEAGMKGAKKRLAARADQQLPRDMRRRTASHNVKRVPKRLRPRLQKEMVEFNTPTVNSRTRKPRSTQKRLRLETAKRIQRLSQRVKVDRSTSKKVRAESVQAGQEIFARKAKPKKVANATAVLSHPPKAAARFRRRQISKTWLPTHLFHAKRARMTAPRDPLWRFAIPITPTQKSYRPTHRAAMLRGAIAWDMSYMSTIGLEGTAENLCTVLQGLSFGTGNTALSPWHKKGQKWREGKRAWEGYTYERNSHPVKPIAPVMVIWEPSETWKEVATAVDLANNRQHAKANNRKGRRKLLVRVHPSAFLHLWNELLAVSKIQYPPVMMEDLRFEIGSIEVTGFAATEALLQTLQPIKPNAMDATEQDPSASTWTALTGLTNAASLPSNAILAFSISDPRLRYPLRLSSTLNAQTGDDRLLSVLAEWPLDRISQTSAIFKRQARLAAGRQLPSQKAVNRRKSLAAPGAYPEPLPTDPQIPIMLCPFRPPVGGQGSWLLLLPWRCVLPVWYTLMHCPLSSGGNVRFGGLDEKRQVAFEAGMPWFPADCPGTRAGWDWELRERDERRREWERKPKGKRIEWTSIGLGQGRKGEIGLGWACDWERLVLGQPAESNADTEGNDQQPDKQSSAKPLDQSDTKPTNQAATSEDTRPLGIYHLDTSLAAQVIRRSTSNIPSALRTTVKSNALCTIKVTLLSRGTPTTCSRVYRLPSADRELRRRWLDLKDNARSKPNPKSKPRNTPRIENRSTAQERRRALAASLLAPPKPRTGPIQAGDPDYPHVPGEEDLVGFVTTGNFSLSEGQGIGIGSVLLSQMNKAQIARESERRLCIVREAGTAIGRLAHWELV